MRIVLPVALSAFFIKFTLMLAAAPTLDQASIVSFIVGIIGICSAVFERLNAKKITDKTHEENQVVSEAKAWKSRSELYEEMSTDFRKLLETERADHQKTREYWHDKATTFQVDLAKCNEECLKLQGRTDITRIEKMLLEQGAHLATVAEGIRELLASK